MCSFLNELGLANTILLDLTRDMWAYISLGYFKQRTIEGEVGSSTMPHKVNPIAFENGEGNLGLANAVATHLVNKLPISRYQRDLSDSTVLRNSGVAFAYSIIAYENILVGLNKVTVNEEALSTELSNHWEVLAEPVQQMMRKYPIANPYELLKKHTRGKKVTEKRMKGLISELKKDMSEGDWLRLDELTPENYIGNAAEMAAKCGEYCDEE